MKKEHLGESHGKYSTWQTTQYSPCAIFFIHTCGGALTITYIFINFIRINSVKYVLRASKILGTMLPR